MNYYFLYITIFLVFKNIVVCANHKKYAQHVHPATASMAYFFNNIKFGKIVAKQSYYDGKYDLPSYGCTVYVYRAIRTISASDNHIAIPANGYFYLDMYHKDHLEVFDSKKRCYHVIALDGRVLTNKTAIAHKERRILPNYS